MADGKSRVTCPHTHYIENKADALLRKDEEGTPASGKNTASLQKNELMAILASNEQDDGCPEQIVPRQRVLFRGNAGPQNG